MLQQPPVVTLTESTSCTAIATPSAFSTYTAWRQINAWGGAGRLGAAPLFVCLGPSAHVWALWVTVAVRCALKRIKEGGNGSQHDVFSNSNLLRRIAKLDIITKSWFSFFLSYAYAGITRAVGFDDGYVVLVITAMSWVVSQMEFCL